MRPFLSFLFATLCLLAGAGAAAAQPLDQNLLAVAKKPTTSALLRSWMSPEVGAAWAAGYRGQKTTITFIDDFTSSSRSYGNLGNGTQLLRHGEWTRLEGSMIAPSASIVSKSFTSGTQVNLAKGLNVLNLSYGMYAAGGYTANRIGWSAQESSIISYARAGKALVVKAAGNDAVAVGTTNGQGQMDYLNLALVGTPSTIFAGAINANGTVNKKASLASYSNRAGADVAVQKRFLVVGVEGNKTGLYGTSFAAPIVAGYGAVLGSKFTTATPTQIGNQLLSTARKDTLLNYNAESFGMGEASLTRALAPRSIR